MQAISISDVCPSLFMWDMHSQEARVALGYRLVRLLRFFRA